MHSSKTQGKLLKYSNLIKKILNLLHRKYLYHNDFCKEDQIKELVGKIRAVNDFCMNSDTFEVTDISTKITEIEEYIESKAIPNILFRK